jgi:cellulose synthase (UDP-forming)
LAVEFVNLSRAQLDSIALVIYSDVKEWYSQKNEFVDAPLASFKFLATSLIRSFQEFKPDRMSKVRKQVRATGQLYFEGEFYSGDVTEMGVSSLLLELSGNAVSSDKMLQDQNLQQIQQQKPLVGLVLSPEEADMAPTRFLAQIVALDVMKADGSNSNGGQVAVELKFPEQFKSRQEAKIKKLLKVLR